MSHVSLSELLLQYRDQSMRGSRSPNTLRLYRHALQALRSYVGHEPTTKDLTDSTVAGLLGRTVARGSSPRTANAIRDRLCALWRFAHRKRLVRDLPDVQPLQEPQRVPVGLTLDELARLYTACCRQEGRVDGVLASLWWTGLLLVAWDGAERIGALLRIEWGHLDGEFLRVPAEHRKGKTRDTVTRLHATTVRHLDLMRATAHGPLVFPWPGNPTSMYYHWGRILRAAGLPVDRAHKFHCLRRSVASHVQARGEDASRVLDHADPATTANYLDPRIVGQVAPCDVLPRPWEAGA